MPRIASTTTAGVPVDPTGGMTLDALMARQKQLADARGEIAAPRTIQDPLQGLAQMAQAFVGARQESAAADQLAAGRAQLAQLLSGVNPETGATPAQSAQIYSLDPEAGARAIEAAAAAIRAKREREQQLADIASQRQFTTGERVAGQEFTAGQTAAGQQFTGGQNQLNRNQQTTLQEDQQKAQADEAERQRQQAIQLQEDQQAAAVAAAAKAAEVAAAKPISGSAQAQADYEAGRFGPVGSPEALAALAAEKAKATAVPAVPGAAQDRKALWGQQDEYINSSAAIGQLARAKQLLDQGINTGYTAGARTMYGAAGGPGGDPDAASRTKEYNSIMNQEAIAAMSQALKGSTTDTEMAEFIKNMNDPTLDPAVKSRQLDRMLAKAAAFNEQQGARIKELGGDVPAKPGDTSGGVDPETLLQSARDAIAKGADPALVKKRLVDKGVDPGKL